MVESRFSPRMAEEIIEAAHVPSGGAYTAVGTYDHSEIVRLVQQLAKATGVPANDLLKEFGKHLFKRFAAGYPMFFEDIDNAFDFLADIENHIHVEVRKL